MPAKILAKIGDTVQSVQSVSCAIQVLMVLLYNPMLSEDLQCCLVIREAHAGREDRVKDVNLWDRQGNCMQVFDLICGV